MKYYAFKLHLLLKIILEFNEIRITFIRFLPDEKKRRKERESERAYRDSNESSWIYDATTYIPRKAGKPAHGLGSISALAAP